MAALLSRVNPINVFPEYHGPYAVGTVDVEVPAASLPQPCDVPEGAPPTVAFRIFYPCVAPSTSEADRPVRWIARPQRLNVAALIRFLGISERKASALSYITQWFYWININAHRNAPMHDAPTSNGRWPVTFFSHGLAGCRNAYSYLCGDMASNGMIVVAMDHRDGSSPVQYVRATDKTEGYSVPANKISHEAGEEVYEARDEQLRIRLWEISLIYEALMKMDAGEAIENLDENISLSRRGRVEVLQRFAGMMDIRRPGKVSWSGHSFGACTMVQCVKSIFYARERPEDAGKPLIKPTSDAAILQQITPDSPTIMLDMWTLPFQSPQQKYLWEKPMPSYTLGGPKGSNLISVLSEGFANWQANANTNKYIIAAPARSRRPSRAPQINREPGRILPQWARLRDESPSRDSGYASLDRSPVRSLTRKRSGQSEQTTSTTSASNILRRGRSTNRQVGPHMFFVQRSQHFSQSDFGILFPSLARYLAKAEEPERILELNNRAIVQMLRSNGIEVAGDEDAEILEREAEIRRWKNIVVHDDEVAASGDVGKVLGVADRKLEMARNGEMAPRDDIAIVRTKMQ